MVVLTMMGVVEFAKETFEVAFQVTFVIEFESMISSPATAVLT